VIFASGLGLPVSSTHVAVGAVFGVGFLREFLTNRRISLNVTVLTPSPEDPDVAAGKFLSRWTKARKRKLVRRRHLTAIIAAWLITVPASAAIAGIILLAIQAFA
jgi:PiT family inorganic phosphate transporter